MTVKRLGLNLVVLLLTSILLAGCTGGRSAVNVKYEVTGAATNISVIYMNRDGGICQESEVTPPWAHTFDTTVSNAFVSLAASNLTDTGSVTVTIYKNGSVFKTATSTGGYVVASVGGML